MRKTSMFAAVAMLAVSSFAATLTTGTKEIGLSGSFDADTAQGTAWDISASYGYFVMDNVEVGVAAGYSDDDMQSVGLIGAFGQYNFDLGNEWVPYVAAAASYAVNDVEIDGESDDENALVLTATAGIQYFISEKTAIDLGANYSFASEDMYYNDDEVEDTNLSFDLGIRFYL